MDDDVDATERLDRRGEESLDVQVDSAARWSWA
jgi:hypothetical protein